MSKLFVIMVGSILVAIGIFLLAGAPFVYSAAAQTPKPPVHKPVAPQPAPLTPFANVAQEPDWSFSAWCGGDYINYRTEWYTAEGVEQVRLRVQWFHSDPRMTLSRSFGYAVYDRDGNLKVSAVTPLAPPGERTTPTSFMEDPTGFWSTYVYRTGTSFKATSYPGVNPLVVMFFFRNRNAVCPLRQVFWFGGKG